jgi:hypothetical protein
MLDDKPLQVDNPARFTLKLAAGVHTIGAALIDLARPGNVEGIYSSRNQSGGVGNLWGTLIGGMSLGIINKVLEPYAGAVLGKIFVLVGLILFIQRRPRGLFPQTGRAAEGA